MAWELDRVSYAPQRLWLRWITVALAISTCLAWAVASISSSLWWLVLVLGLALLACGGALGYFKWMYHRHSRLRDQLRAGLKGQNLLPQVLAGMSDDYYLLSNLNLPGRRDDIDHVVIGPNGIFALETKHHRGRIHLREGHWYQSKMSRAGHLQPDTPIRDPVLQLKRNVDYLRTCINRTDRDLSHSTHLWIEGAVIFTHPAVSLDLPEEVLAGSPFPVLRVRDLPAHIAHHGPRRPHPQAEVRQILSLLAHLQPAFPTTPRE